MRRGRHTGATPERGRQDPCVSLRQPAWGLPAGNRGTGDGPSEHRAPGGQRLCRNRPVRRSRDATRHLSDFPASQVRRLRSLAANGGSADHARQAEPDPETHGQLYQPRLVTHSNRTIASIAQSRQQANLSSWTSPPGCSSTMHRTPPDGDSTVECAMPMAHFLDDFATVDLAATAFARPARSTRPICLRGPSWMTRRAAAMPARRRSRRWSRFRAGRPDPAARRDGRGRRGGRRGRHGR